MKPIFDLPPDSPLAPAITGDPGILPLRVPHGWNVVHNTFTAWRLPDGHVETYDSEDLYWAQTRPLPFLTEEEVREAAEEGNLRARDINVDVGWYGPYGYRVVVFETDWDHVWASHSTHDLDELVATLERWMWLISSHGELPESSSEAAPRPRTQ